MGKNKIKLEISRIEPSKTSIQGYVLSLSEVEEKKSNKKRRLRIIIGPFEAQAIVIAIEKLKTSRPLTHELFKNFADTLGITIKEVIINRFIEGVFHSIILFSDGTKTFEVDSRTSDAVALAIRFNSPIYTYEEILNLAGEPDEVFEPKFESDIEQIDNKIENENVELQYLSIEELQQLLNEAIEKEEYEKASKIRDEINKRKQSKQ
ncbi:MAG TPA: bifunctional nuclease family protein [Bacteroidales bacterium]|nr:bifunctional nuclease family protein [Bacteroidales bacterium]